MVSSRPSIAFTLALAGGTWFLFGGLLSYTLLAQLCGQPQFSSAVSATVGSCSQLSVGALAVVASALGTGILGVLLLVPRLAALRPVLSLSVVGLAFTSYILLVYVLWVVSFWPYVAVWPYLYLYWLPPLLLSLAAGLLGCLSGVEPTTAKPLAEPMT